MAVPTHYDYCVDENGDMIQISASTSFLDTTLIPAPFCINSQTILRRRISYREIFINKLIVELGGHPKECYTRNINQYYLACDDYRKCYNRRNEAAAKRASFIKLKAKEATDLEEMYAECVRPSVMFEDEHDFADWLKGATMEELEACLEAVNGDADVNPIFADYVRTEMVVCSRRDALNKPKGN